ncbi:MAG: hypothetical protein K6E83_04685, partial [Clostridium sp.]|nr:hypothetical protein [Clostridium sp.]
MKKYAKNIEDRKVLVARLSDLTGLEAHYTRVPRCAYEIGSFTVEKDGTLVAEDNADQNIIETLLAENLIKENDEPREEAAPEMTSQDFETEEWEEDDWSEVADAPVSEPEEVRSPIAETFETEAPEVIEVQSTPSSMDEPETETEEAAAEVQTEAEDAEADDADLEEPDEPLEATIAFPLHQHTSTSLVNLVCMIYSRGLLLSKATGGEFYASKELVDALLDHPAFIRPSDVVDFLQSLDGQEQRLVGLSFNEEQVIFDGFGVVRDADHLQTFMKLAAVMNKMAITQKRVQAREVNSENEKYALRVWLIRLGMNGAGYKEDRKRLMKNLTGHTAFRNEADKARWTARQTAKREALKAAKTAD